MNVDVVNAWHEALNAGDADRLASLSHPEVTMEGPRGAVRGRDVLKDWVARANVRMEPLRRFGRGRTVVVEQRATWRDVETGQETGRATVATVFGLSGGLVAVISRHEDLQRALESAGLGPSDETP